MSNLSRSSLHTRRVAITAIFLSIALVLRLFATFYLPIYGANGHRVSPGAIFAILPAILFGPIYGAIVAGLFDLLGWLLRPSGAFLPWMTVVVTAGGLLRGLLWRGLQNRSRRILRICLLTLAAVLLLFGLLNFTLLHIDGIDSGFYTVNDPQSIDPGNMHFISRLLIERTQGAASPADALSGMRMAVTWGLVGASLFALLLLAVEFIFSKRLIEKERFDKLLPLAMTILLSSLFVSTMNTFVLHPIFWPAIPFVATLIPRIIASLLVDTVFVYFAAVLLGLFQRQQSLRQLIK